MKVLVSGASGQLGQSLLERARTREGIELIALSRQELDLERRGSALTAIMSTRPDIVINTAAYTAVDQAEDEPERAFQINAEGAREVADAAGRVGAGVVQISTDYVFNGRAAGAYNEQASVDPLGVYGRSKLAGEEGVRSANRRYTIVRTAWVVSPFGRNFLKSIMAAAQGRDELTVVDDQRGSPTSALDLADGLLTMLKKNVRWGETYHLAGSGEASWCEVAHAVMAECRRLGLHPAEVRPIRTEDWPTRAVRPRNSVLDCSKFQRDYGFAMPDWRESVRQVVERLAQDQVR